MDTLRSSLVVAGLALLAACHERRADEATIAPTASLVPTSSQLNAAPVAVIDSGTPRSTEACVGVAGEPIAPVIECTFERKVWCVPPFPVRSAWQKDFPACPLRLESDRSPNHLTMPFSACETRARNARGEGGCCYVEFQRSACD